jgi:DNA integrity scanning protein DisA with diadenylate cyclase activity
MSDKKKVAILERRLRRLRGYFPELRDVALLALAREFANLPQIAAADDDDLRGLPGVGEAMVKYVRKVIREQGL